MAVFRVNKTTNYTVMSNRHLKDKNLSLKAKGLLSVMLSLPDDWDYSIEGLVSISKESETSIKGTLHELKENNYLLINKHRDNNGRFEYIYDIYEVPEHNLPEVENPPLENPEVDEPEVENIGQLNTNNKVLNNKILNNNKVVEEYEKEIGLLTPFQFQKLFSYKDDLSEDMIIEAIHRASAMNKKSLAYIEAILKAWISSGYKVVADIEDKSKGKHEETNEERLKRLCGD